MIQKKHMTGQARGVEKVNTGRATIEKSMVRSYIEVTFFHGTCLRLTEIKNCKVKSE